MKRLVVLSMILTSVSSWAGSLECIDKARHLRLSMADHQSSFTIDNGKTLIVYPLTKSSAKQSRYKLPLHLFSNTDDGFALRVYKRADTDKLAATLYANYLSKKFTETVLDCVYEVSE